MYKKRKSSWLKHLDFTILDCICMELALILAYFLRHGWGNLYNIDLYKESAGVILLLHLSVVYFREGYKGIIRRGYFEEFKVVVMHMTIVAVLLNVYLYLVKRSGDYSRAMYMLMWLAGIFMIYTARILWKRHIKTWACKMTVQQAMLLVSLKENAGDTLEVIKQNNFGDYCILGVVLLDGNEDDINTEIEGVPVVADKNSVIEYIRYHWVDEVFFDMSHSKYDYEKLIADCEVMGVTVHQKLAVDSELYRHNQIVERLSGFTVLTSSINLVSNGQLFCKRAMDIAGAIVGIIITAILFVFIAPCIYIKSPGPIFFSQLRVGKNGRKFKIYKFRSMYMDAEERKKELMEQNNIKSGLMFKMDHDPRVIKGIGEFIRRTSLDEFPQFWNILKGDMSLVGTRPPTVDEWSKYEIYHRKRMAIKPGLTGMWQVSGRSKIIDFDEVVELDTKYIKEWSIGVDLKILFKTIAVVFKREGAS